MPIAISTVLNADLTILQSQPQTVKQYLNVLTEDFAQHLDHYDQKYQRLIELKTIRCLHLMDQIPVQWVKIVKKLTHEAQRNLQRLSRNELDQKLFTELVQLITPLQQAMLKPIYLADPDYLKATVPNYDFTIDDLDILRRQKINIDQLIGQPIPKIEALKNHYANNTELNNSIDRFLSHFLQIKMWSKLILENIAHLYQGVYHQHNPAMVAIINLYANEV